MEAKKLPRRRLLLRALRVALLLFLLLLAFVYFVYLLPFWGIPFNKSRHGRVPLTPPWALECWLWEDDVNTAAFVTELLEGYAKHDLPVRTLLLDSPWSWRYNDFLVDENRYPEPEKFFTGLQEKGYRVVLWMTPMVNSFSKDTRERESQAFASEARGKGYLAADGREIRWWKGRGGFIDYSNPEAVNWWHGMQRQVLDWGVDGWKLDGADTLFSSAWWKLPVPFSRTHSGWMTTRTYMDHYARDEYRHGLTRNPEFVTLIRALDGPWAHPEGFAPLDAAPVTWVGDNQHTWSRHKRGLERAILDILGSARLGYCVIGSDVGGYHGRRNPEDIAPATTALLASWKSREPAATNAVPSDFGSVPSDDAIPPNIYIRWAQFSAFCGLFLNGGHGERRLWKRTPAELEIIRKFSWLHTELVPYIYSHVVTCHRGGPPLMRPVANGQFEYRFGDDFFVAPIHEDKLARTVQLPAGQWRYLFDDRELIQGPVELTRDFPLEEYPVYVREGAVVPLRVTRSYTGFGDGDSGGYVTWLVYPQGTNSFTLYNPESHPNPESTTLTVMLGKELRLEFTGKQHPHILRIHSKTKPTKVILDETELTEGDAWRFDATDERLIIKSTACREGRYVISWP